MSTAPTPNTTPQRFRHAPTPRDPSLPKTMRVGVEVGFVQSCPDCRAIIKNLSAACIDDSTVSRFVAVPGSKHAHEVTDGGGALPGLSASAAIDTATGLPVSDTNGSDPANVDAVHGALFATGPSAGESDPG